MVLIKRGSRFAFRFLDTILKSVGKVIDRHISSGREQHRIRAVVQTMQDHFHPQITFEYNVNKSLVILLDYIGLNIRCYKCFSHNHLAADCNKNTYGNIKRPRNVTIKPDIVINTPPIHTAYWQSSARRVARATTGANATRLRTRGRGDLGGQGSSGTAAQPVDPAGQGMPPISTPLHQSTP